MTETTGSPPILRTIGQLDAAWLEQALGCAPITSFSATRIGTGQMSECHRVTLSYADGSGDPPSVVLKLAAADRSSRATGLSLGIYAREVRFYRELAGHIAGPLPRCRVALADEREGWFTLALEDATPAAAGDQIAGCSIDQARPALTGLAQLHAPMLGREGLARGAWLNRDSPIDQALVSQLLPAFLDRYGERIAADHGALCERLVGNLDAWLADRSEPLGLVHGDYRLDNLLFGAPGSAKPLTVVDWQTVGWGEAMADVAYFLGGSLRVEDRRRYEHELLGSYHAALCQAGVQGLTVERCLAQYRRMTFGGVLMVIVASMLVERTERGDEMFMAMLARHSQHAIDLAATELLPGGEGERSARRPAPLAPQRSDEGRHAPEPQMLWNESWYFDAAAADGSVGAYVRVGLYPNLGACWYTALICGPGRPTVAVVDFAAPLPAPGGLDVRTGALRAAHRCVRPLALFAVSLEADGQAHTDPAALLRGGRGRPTPVAVALELEWQTAATPYAYRLTTRYEIACRVSGKIRLDGEELELDGAPGQRDHSWGVRDWWSMDWVWSAAHMRDGTHLHAVQLRLPGVAPLGAGYVQRAGGALEELDRVAAGETLAPDGLIAAAGLELEPAGLRLAVRPLAFAPLRLQSPDGRVSHFPRAMCAFETGDGRAGVGWMEWNLNQPAG